MRSNYWVEIAAITQVTDIDYEHPHDSTVEAARQAYLTAVGSHLVQCETGKVLQVPRRGQEEPRAQSSTSQLADLK